MIKRIYYGLISRNQAAEIIKAVCGVLGNGKNGTAPNQIIEICAQETQLGLFKDPTSYGAGTGLTQIDEPTFEDIRNRTRRHNAEIIQKHFGIDIDRVSYVELEHSPLLSIVFCRLYLKLFDSEIPADVKHRALWWKSYYNTELGDGTVAQYLENATRHGVDKLLNNVEEIT